MQASQATIQLMLVALAKRACAQGGECSVTQG